VILRAGLVQITASDDPAANLPVTAELIRRAAAEGAALIQTPEVTNIVTLSRTRQNEVLRREEEDATLAALRDLAAALGVWLNIGSLALKTDDAEGRFANRSFLIDDRGEITARYDKIHMFDVALADGESYRESSGYRPGDRAVLAETPWGGIGLTICYDMRFPQLYRALAEAGAVLLTAPSAFTLQTGRAHWRVLLRARAIETGAFVLAAAQCGAHPAARGPMRRTFGHSLAVDPWGAVLGDGGEAPGITLADLDIAASASARAKIPALANSREFLPPERP
jgi:predicted amidohydrolase